MLRVQELFNKVIAPETHPEPTSLSINALLDVLVGLYEDCKSFDPSPNSHVASFLDRYQNIINKVKSKRVNKFDFQVIKKLAKGHFGTVSVVRNKIDGKVYAMKTLNKLYILKCKELSFYMEERDVLSLSRYSQWIPKLYAAFQDYENLYLVMEYAGGGDLFNLLDRNYPPIVGEDEARFYLAEIALALNDLHRLNYVHRDLKPQNILIDNTGHIKLADFGSCIQMNPNGLITSNIPVGTSDYISPEVLQAQEGNVCYGRECDWWSLGILLYELLQGDPPFSSDNLMETHSQIMNHKNHLIFHDIYPISEEAKDLIKKLVCDRESRLGKSGFDEIKAHPFFSTINWDDIRNQTPPFVPSLLAPDDTSNFSGYEGEEDQHEVKVSPRPNQKDFLGIHLPFIGFTYMDTGSTTPPQSQKQLVNNQIETTEARSIDPPQDESILSGTSTSSSKVGVEIDQPTLSNDTTLNGSPQKNHNEYEDIIAKLKKQVEGLTAGLQACQQTILQQKQTNSELTSTVDRIRMQLMVSEDEKNEQCKLFDILEARLDEEEAARLELQELNQSLEEERDKSRSETKKLKRALTELNEIYQGTKEAVTTMDQSRAEADSNFSVMRSKCESLMYENESLNAKLQHLEAKWNLVNPDQLPQLRDDLNRTNTELAKVRRELDMALQDNDMLTNQIEQLKQQSPPPSESSSGQASTVPLDSRVYNEIVANLQLETKNHTMLNTIHRDLRQTMDLRPELDETRESRDEALHRTDQMIQLNEKQANLIKTLMEKITYLEATFAALPETGIKNRSLSLQDRSLPSAQVAQLVAENFRLKQDIDAKEQNIQGLVTKLVVAETARPTLPFFGKAKDKLKDQQRILIHQIQNLEGKLRQVERENSQLRFMGQLAAAKTNDINEVDDNPDLEETDDLAPTLGYPKLKHNLLLTDDASLLQTRSHPTSNLDLEHINFNQKINGNHTDLKQAISTKFGIAHIK